MVWAFRRALGRRAILASAACAFAGCVPPQGASRLPSHQGMRISPPLFDYGAETRWLTLPNGLRVALNPDPHANLVSVALRFEVGSAEDPAGKPGLAHVVEHMTFIQRTEPGGPTLSDQLQLVTLDRNATTSFDATHFYSVALAPQLDQLLAFEATRLERGCRGIDQASFERELAIVALEIDGRDLPGAAAVHTEVFGAGHAYSHTPGGAVAGLTLADVCSFIDAHYAPERAVLLVGGRFDPAALSAAVTARFGRIRRRATGAPARVAPPRIETRTTELHAAIARPNALVILPAAAWGSSQALDEALLDDLVVRGLESIAERKPWLVHASHGRLGGARGGVRYIAIEVDDPARLGDAAKQVFGLASVIARRSPDAVSSTLERWRISLLDRFESFISRAQLCADALQFAGDQHCRVGELREMEIPHTQRVAMRAIDMAKGPRRVIHVLPSDGTSATAELAIPAPDAPETEIHPWRAPVDPAEADRPIALPAGLQTSDISQFSLPNGLRVVLASNFTQPLVDARLVFPVGATGDVAHDVLARAAARLLDHDLSRGYPRNDIAILRWLFEIGASRYVEVTDHTTFRIRGPAKFADWHLWRLSWLIREGEYSSSTVSQLRLAASTRSRRASSDDADGALRLRRAVREALYGREHPFARARDEELNAQIGALTAQDLARFHDLHYAPAGATLIVSGRFDPGEMRSRVIELFASWSAPAPPALAPVPAMQPAQGPTWITSEDPAAVQVGVTVTFAATSRREASRAARAVLAEIMRARLTLIRTEMLASYGVDAGYLQSIAGDVIQIDGAVSAARAGEVLRRLLADLEKLRRGDAGLRADFVRARRAALAATLADPSIPSATGSRLEHAVTSHAAIARESLASEIASMRLSDVARVIAQDLQPGRMVGALSGRPADVAAALATAGITGANAIAGATAMP